MNRKLINKLIVVVLFSLSIVYAKEDFCLTSDCENETRICHKFDNIKSRSEYPHSINVFWLLRDADLTQEYIYPAKDETDLFENFILKVTGWSIKNPEKTVVQVWYDSALVSEEAVNNTRELIESIVNKVDLHAPILLKDVRSVPLVQENDYILSTLLDVYTRVDLIREVIVFNEIVTEGVSYAMYADMDMPRVTYEELYDAETLLKLEKYGIVFTHISNGIRGSYENNFQIICHNNNLLEAFQLALIESTFGHLRFYLDALKKSKVPMRSIDSHGITCSAYDEMLNYFCYLEIYGRQPMVGGFYDSEVELYNRQKHGIPIPLKAWGILPDSLVFKYDMNEMRENCCIPTKKVEMPQSKHYGLNYFKHCILSKEEEESTNSME